MTADGGRSVYLCLVGVDGYAIPQLLICLCGCVCIIKLKSRMHQYWSLPSLLSPWLKWPRLSPVTRTWANDFACCAGVPTAVIHRSTNDSTSLTSTNLNSCEHLLDACKPRRKHKFTDRTAAILLTRDLYLSLFLHKGMTPPSPRNVGHATQHLLTVSTSSQVICPKLN